MNERLPILRKKAVGLPQNPGVYIMKNKQDTIIYIGKAKSLKNRVSQYFGSQNRHTIKVLKMVSNVYDFDYIITDSEFEALLLECGLIKQHKPKYNILLKDDKGYHYIKISNDGWRKITAEKKMLDDKAEYIGPYTSAFIVNQALDEAQKIFKLPQCSKEFPRDIGKGRPCLNYFISQCSAPCSGKVKKEEYDEAIDGAIEFLKGGSAKSIKDMQDKMQEFSDSYEFEKAARLRDRINAIKKMNEKQKVIAAGVKEQDVFALEQGEKNACFAVLRFSQGQLFDTEHFIIENDQDLPQMRAEIIKSYYSMRQKVPRRITLDGATQDTALLSQWLSVKAGHKVTLVVPQKGEQLKLVQMCKKNAQEKLFERVGRTDKNKQALTELASLLGLGEIPQYIESYDISHTAGCDNVAGMVVFKDGLPYKSGYKRFEIKHAQGGDDCAAMQEVLQRRFARYEQQKETHKGFGKLPDLILLDGGQGQLNAVLPVLKQFGLDIPVFGMVKDNKHKTRAITNGGSEISISVKRQAFTLVSNIQEEVHRFAISYHREKHSKNSINSTLNQIKGIGQTKTTILLKYFKTISAIKSASIEDLANVKGISITNAKDIYEYFNITQ
ncbi:MAG: excinuclease ABC subunit UvrC [Clostridia bacterium]|nr:excinuclease ABC subunit UvrC [Clostridia bacterium]